MENDTAVYNHSSVMPRECIDGLNIKPGGVYIDATAGGGGHSALIAEKLARTGFLLGIDRDADAIRAAGEKLRGFNNCKLVRGNFTDIRKIAADCGVNSADGILADLGVSSYQLENAERGFSFLRDGPLDMRMDAGSVLTAREIVNTYSKEKLNDIIFNYGEERWAKRIAEFIVTRREDKPIETTLDLVSVICAAVPKNARDKSLHPATRTFQAIRIAVNGELETLAGALKGMVETLNPGGRLCVISFHSLEDRIVKQTFGKLADPCECPRDLPVCVCGLKPSVKILTKKPAEPAEDELAANRRSRSAKLRIVEKLRGVC